MGLEDDFTFRQSDIAIEERPWPWPVEFVDLPKSGELGIYSLPTLDILQKKKLLNVPYVIRKRLKN